MARGPLPDPDAVRRNAPTIPTTQLPAGGRKGAAPKVPSWMDLGKSGLAWWRWAWKTPQAAGWSSGDEPMIARRAQLEDDMASLEEVAGLDFADLGQYERDAEIDRAIRRVSALATGRLAIAKQMLELEDRLGLTPKGMAALRWKVVAEQKKTPRASSGTVARLDDRRKRVTGAS